MSENTKEPNKTRTAKLIVCALAILLVFVVVLADLSSTEGPNFITQGICWLVIYSSIALVISDILDTLERGNRYHWVWGVFCMPIIAVPY